MAEAVLYPDLVADSERADSGEPPVGVVLDVPVRGVLPGLGGLLHVRGPVSHVVGYREGRLGPPGEEHLGGGVAVGPGRGSPLEEVLLELGPVGRLGEEVLARTDSLFGEPVGLVVVGGRELVLDVHLAAPLVERLPELWPAVCPDDLGPADLDEKLIEGRAYVVGVQSLEVCAHGVPAQLVRGDDEVLARELEEVDPDLVHGAQILEWRLGLVGLGRKGRPEGLAPVALVDHRDDVVLHLGLA